jgi:hypothetical protein
LEIEVGGGLEAHARVEAEGGAHGGHGVEGQGVGAGGSGAADAFLHEGVGDALASCGGRHRKQTHLGPLALAGGGGGAGRAGGVEQDGSDDCAFVLGDELGGGLGVGERREDVLAVRGPEWDLRGVLLVGGQRDLDESVVIGGSRLAEAHGHCAVSFRIDVSPGVREIAIAVRAV